MSDDERLERVSRRYWRDGSTMEVIADEEQVSRSTVSRLLDAARARGIVSITVHTVHERARVMAAELNTRFGITTRVIGVPEEADELSRLELVAEATGRVLDEAMTPGTRLGIAWGVTTSAVGRHLLARPLHDAQVVQLNGAMNTHSSGVGYGSDVLGRFGSAWNAQVHHFPVPAFFDDPRTREAMWRERSVRRVLGIQHSAHVALFGVGAVSGALPSRVYAEGYLTAADKADLASHSVVGDVCTVFLRADGSWHGIPLNARSSGLTPPALRRVPRRICVVSGRHKVVPLAGVLAAGLVTDLVIDALTARELLLHRPSVRARPAGR